MTNQPVKNAALYFRNLDKKTGKGHPNTLHAGNPLETDKIQKYAINSWIREKDLKNNEYISGNMSDDDY